MPEALYRKYRPQVFADVVGQEPIERTLKNAIEQDKVSHAYLFTGPRGTGKTTTARLLAKALLCEKGPTPEPDGTCEDCNLIAEGVHPDVYELDAASRTGVENVREEIISRVQYAPTRGRSKVYIIDEVHMLSTAAFNALLKTLEEPPDHVVFILCTTDPQKVPETIHSRCQRFDFHRIAPEAMVTRLGAICMAEEVEFEGEALDLIAQRADGGLRNALTSLEQIIAFENGKITLAGAERLLGSIDSSDLSEIMALIGQRDIANCFRWIADYVETGADLAQFVRDMAEHVRNLYILTLSQDDAVLDVSETTRHALATEIQWYSPERASRLLGVLGDLSAELKTSSNPRLAFEIALTRMVRPDSDLTLQSLAERIEALESGYSSVAHVLPNEVSLHQSSNFVAPVAKAEESKAISSGTETASQSKANSSAVSAVDAPSTSSVPSSSPHPVAPASEKPDDTPVSVAGSKLDSLTNPASLQRIWQAILSTVKKKKQAYGVLFLNTKATFDANSATLCINFPAEASFAFKAVQGSDVQDTLAQAITNVVGQSVSFVFTQGNQEQSAPLQTATVVSQVEVSPNLDESSKSEIKDVKTTANLEMQNRTNEQIASAAFSPEPFVDQVIEAPIREAEDYVEGALEAVSVPSVRPQPDFDSTALDNSDSFQSNLNEETLKPEQSQSNEENKVFAPEERKDTSEESINDSASLDDVQALLQSGFGSDLVFEEVDE